MYKKHTKKGFTLAEALIVTIVLGIIAVIVIPPLIEKEYQNESRSKVRKAMADYEKVVAEIKIVQNLSHVEGEDLYSLDGWSKYNSYANGKSYFKIKLSGDEPYKFQTYDGVWWNIEKMSKSIISLNDECKDSIPTTNKKSSCINKVFYLTTTYAPEKGNTFIVNAPTGYAQNTLVFAKIIEKSFCNKQDTCTKNGVYFEKRNVDPTVTVDLAHCYDSELKVNKPCKSTVAAKELYYSGDIEVRSPLVQEQNGSNAWEKCKNFCEQNGARLPSIAELKASGKSGRFYNASEEFSNGSMYQLTPEGGVRDYYKSDLNYFVCVSE